VNVPDWLAPYCLFGEGSGSGDVLKSYFKNSALRAFAVAESKQQHSSNTGDDFVELDYKLIKN
jgi:hypothetical protein